MEISINISRTRARICITVVFNKNKQMFSLHGYELNWKYPRVSDGYRFILARKKRIYFWRLQADRSMNIRKFPMDDDVTGTPKNNRHTHIIGSLYTCIRSKEQAGINEWDGKNDVTEQKRCPQNYTTVRQSETLRGGEKELEHANLSDVALLTAIYLFHAQLCSCRTIMF